MAYRWLALPVLGLALCLGCDLELDDDSYSLDADALSERFACADVTVVAANDDGSEALLIGVEDGLAAAALAGAAPIAAEYELPDERLTVRWVAGTNVYQGHCGRDSGEPWQLDHRLDAVAGHISVVVEPRPDGTLAVTAELADLLLEADAEAEAVVDLARFETLELE